MMESNTGSPIYITSWGDTTDFPMIVDWIPGVREESTTAPRNFCTCGAEITQQFYYVDGVCYCYPCYVKVLDRSLWRCK